MIEIVDADTGEGADLPQSIFWPLTVVVDNDGDPVPFPVWLTWHHQFFIPKPSTNTKSVASHALK